MQQKGVFFTFLKNYTGLLSIGLLKFGDLQAKFRTKRFTFTHICRSFLNRVRLIPYTEFRIASLLLGITLGTACNKEPQPTSKSTSNSPLTAPLDYVGAVGRAKKSAEGTVDLASVTKAIQMYHASEGQFPESLETLVKERYLPALPKLPTGLKFSYNSSTGEAKLIR